METKTTHKKQQQNKKTLKYSSYCSEVKGRMEMGEYFAKKKHICFGCGKYVSLKAKRFNYLKLK